jgi:hypothetical protein
MAAGERLEAEHFLEFKQMFTPSLLAPAVSYAVLDEDDDVIFSDELLIFGFPRFGTSAPQRSGLVSARYVTATGLNHLPNRVLHKFRSERIVPGYSCTVARCSVRQSS